MQLTPVPLAMNSRQAIGAVIKYHEATKHSLSRYANGPLGLDWANQPNPFRRYNGAHLAYLEHPEQSDELHYTDVFQMPPTPSQPLTKSTLSQLLYDSLALSAWKSTEYSTWSLRVNPSSGNLHPTEGYVISGPVPGVSNSPFIAHYAPKEHALEIRANLPPSAWSELVKGFPPGSLFVGLSSILWREAWKYGERAYRYCNHDVGHAVGAVAVSAAMRGWKTLLLDSWTCHELQILLGLPHRAEDVAATKSSRVVKGRFPELEEEHPDCVMVVFPGVDNARLPSNWSPSKGLISQLSQLSWAGRPNSLSREHVRWDIIYQAARAANKAKIPDNHKQVQEAMDSSSSGRRQGEIHPYEWVYKRLPARQVVRSRRSAVSMDGRQAMQRDAFYQILLKAMPALGSHKQLPFSTLPWAAELHMALFVHRVDELEQGLYFLVRNPLHEHALKLALRSEFEWQKPPGCPPELPLFLLTPGDCRVLAKQLSCNQEIASDGCFSLGMIARFEDPIKELGAWMYPRLFWESGLLGQLLYLEAHAIGISATGIGCYFDDPVHELLGISDTKFQSLYHFTIGVPVLDRRILSLPPYPGPSGNVF